MVASGLIPGFNRVPRDAAYAEAAEALGPLEEAASVAQHHDGITGTSKQHVASDYAQRISHGHDLAAEAVVGPALMLLSGKHHLLHECLLRNVSACALTAAADDGFDVVAFNPLAWSRSAERLAVPVGAGPWVVTDAVTGDSVDAQLLPTPPSPDADAAPFTLHVFADFGPMSTRTFAVRPDTTAKDVRATDDDGGGDGDDDSSGLVTVNGDHVTLTFDPSTARLVSMSVVDEDGDTVQTSLDQGFYYYEAFQTLGMGAAERAAKHTPVRQHVYGARLMDGSDDQHSGAYIFRPADPNSPGIPYDAAHAGSGADDLPVDDAPSLVVNDGPLVVEVLQDFGLVTQVVRLVKSSRAVELEWTVDGIPIGDGVGKEVVSRFTTDIASDGKWATDSNGREYLERVRDFRPTWNLTVTQPVAGNFYPITSGMSLKDDTAQLSIAVDRAQAGASLVDGSLELMVQRRLLQDDSRGVGEPLNETAYVTSYDDSEACKGCHMGPPQIVRGVHTLTLTKPANGVKALRTVSERIDQPLVAVFSDVLDPVAAPKTSPGAPYELPQNVKLLTLMPWQTGKDGGPLPLLARFAHLYAVGEDADLSQAATVPLEEFFGTLGLAVESVEWMSLTGNMLQADADARKLAWLVEGEGGRDDDDAGKVVRELKDGGTDLVLEPMQIVTVRVHLKG